jgi:hypothetical protein
MASTMQSRFGGSGTLSMIDLTLVSGVRNRPVKLLRTSSVPETPVPWIRPRYEIVQYGHRSVDRARHVR